MAIKKIVAPTTEAELSDSVSRAETSGGGTIQVPGSFKDWLTPRPKGKSPLDPVLLAARKSGAGKTKNRPKVGPYERRVKVDTTVHSGEDVELGSDGLPRGRK
jgi:hypothetical protein